MRVSPLSVLLLVIGSAASAQQYSIATFAGGVPPATPTAGVNASIGAPSGVAVDPAGNLFILSNNCVFKLSPGGTLTRVAGNSRYGFSGDGGSAVNAQLATTQAPSQYPFSSRSLIALDNQGNLYIADTFNNRIRKVSPSGLIMTVAGGGLNSADGILATDESLNNISGVATDAHGNVYVAETDRNKVRMVSPSGIITTIAGTGSLGSSGDGGAAINAQLNAPWGLATDIAGNLYIADSGNYRVRRVTSDGVINTVAGVGTPGYSGDGGQAVNAEFRYLSGLAVDPAGNLYIADLGNRLVRRVKPDGTVSTVAGIFAMGFGGRDGGPATSAPLAPLGLAADAAGSLFIADADFPLFHMKVRKVSPDGIITTVAGNGTAGYSGDDGPAANAQFAGPSGLAFDSSGNLFISDHWNGRVRRVSPNGIVNTVSGNGTLPEGLFFFGQVPGDGGQATAAPINAGPIAVDRSGNLYISDAVNNIVRRVTPAGIITTVAGNLSAGYSGDGGVATEAQLRRPVGLAVDAAGNLFIVDAGNFCVRKVSTAGIITTVAGRCTQGYSYQGDGVPATNALLEFPEPLAVDSAGNLFIGDNSRVRKVSNSGIITTIAGNDHVGFTGDGGPATAATLLGPTALVVDNTGAIFIGDRSVIRRVSPDGIITTVGGIGSLAYSGDGGPANGASFARAEGLALDGTGKLYLADFANQAIRVLLPNSLNVAKTHTGDLRQGQQGATYTVTVSNPNNVPLSGDLTVTENLPAGLTLVSMSGSGWTCSGATCTRAVNSTVPSGSFPMAPGSGYPSILVKVNVASNAPLSVANSVTVSSGGSVVGQATDSAFVLTTCMFSVTPATVNASSGSFTTSSPITGSFRLSAANCGPSDTWTAASDSPRLRIVGQAAGDGSTASITIHYSLFTNTTTQPRDFHITVAGQTLTITQAGSQENQSQRVVRALYQSILGREPDAGGWGFWTGPGAPASAGGPVLFNQMADGFYTSAEFRQNGFEVFALYQAILGRLPGYNAWTSVVAQLRSGSLTASQLANNLAGPVSDSVFVQEIVLGAYGRAATPQDLANLTSILHNSRAADPRLDLLDNTIFQNAEFTSRTNPLLVGALYYTILTREMDSGGFDFWLTQLNPPMGQPGIYYLYNPQPPTGVYQFKLMVIGQAVPPNPAMLGFLGSPEFQDLIR